MNTDNKKNVARALLLATTVIVFSGCNSGTVATSPTPTESINHVLYIGLDGGRADAIRKTTINSQNESSVQKFLEIKILSSKIY